MTDDPDDLDKLLGSLAKSGGLRSNPDPEEHPGSGLLYAYHEGKLSPEERPRIEEHLSLCGRCRDLLVEYREFIEVPAAARWAGVADFAAARRRGTRRYALAAVAAMALVGFSAYMVSRFQGPHPSDGTTTLVAWESRLGPTSDLDEFQLPETVLLKIPTSDTHSSYRAQILDDRNQHFRTFKELESKNGEVPLPLRKHFLEPGDYTVHLFGGDREPLGTYSFRVLREE